MLTHFGSLSSTCEKIIYKYDKTHVPERKCFKLLGEALEVSKVKCHN